MSQDAISELEKKLHSALDSSLGILKSESSREVAGVRSEVKQLREQLGRTSHDP